MATANLAITFDDGPLPSDNYDIAGLDKEMALAPLEAILAALKGFERGPIPATFYLRGPAYPWAPAPPEDWFQYGIDKIVAADTRHQLGLHCFRHDPKLWFYWYLHLPSEIGADLDRALTFFAPKVGNDLAGFRPPYGQGGPAAFVWAASRGLPYRTWDMDSEDWRHHRDAIQIGFGAYQNDADIEAHRQHIIAMIEYQLKWLLPSDAPLEILLHVSKRTASYLGSILHAVSENVARLGYDFRFVPSP